MFIESLKHQSSCRNQNIELLRVLMMLLIVVMHISGHSVDLDTIRTGGDINSYWILSYRSFTYLGVPTFAFISGYYGISFKLKKLINMEVMAITYGIIVILTCIFFHVDNKISNYISLLFPASSGFLWYYSSYIYLFLLCSFINIVIEKMNQTEIFYAFVVFIVVVYLLRSNIFGQTNDFLMLFVIYIVGRYLKMYPIKIIENNCVVIFFATQLLNIFLFIIFARLGLSKVVAILEGTNILTFISAICLFYVFLRKKRTSYMEK